MNPSIVLLTGNHLCHNPRAVKEASSLARAGYSVTVLGAWTDAGLKERDQALTAEEPFTFVPVLDLAGAAPRIRARRLLHRVVGKSAGVTHRWLGIESRYQLGGAAGALARIAQDIPADLYVAHSEPALFAARTLAASGRRIAVDMEDWFSEDLRAEVRKVRPLVLLRKLERTLLRGASYSSCPSQAMGKALAREFDCGPPTAVYNAFPWADRDSLDGLLKDRRDRSRLSIHWYSQTLGEGRGLEDLVAALPSVSADAEIHLRGVPAPGFETWLAARTAERWRDRIFLHPLVSNEELLSRVAEHDIGFAGETKEIRSRDLTVTNKILHYLLGGLAVVASDTAGQREVEEKASGAVHLYSSGDPGALAAQLNLLLDRPELLGAAKAAALQAAEATFSWEKQEPRLFDAVRRALSSVNR